jgi:hypothetical protein
MIDDIVEGETIERGPFTLEADGTAIDLTGLTVTLVLRDREGSLVSTSGKTRVDDDPTTGRVYWTPGATDVSAAKSPYEMHWSVEDGDGAKAFSPNGRADGLSVYRA